jgi:hypothetical protein
MTNRERLLKVLSFEPVDRLPNYELGIWGQTLDRWLSEGMPPDVMYNDWFEGDVYFHFDRRAYARIHVGYLPGWDYEVLEEDERYVTARHWNGVVTRALKEGTSRGTRASMDQYLAHPVTDRASFRDLLWRLNPESPTRYPFWWDEQARLWKDRDYPLILLSNGTFGLYSGLRNYVGTEGLSYLFHDDPAFVEEMLDTHTERFLQMIERALEDVEFDYFNFFEDLAGKGGPLISPQLFRRFLLPRYQRIIERMRKAGIRHFWFDSDGDVGVLIPLLIEAGITCLWPLEQASGMDPVRLRKEYGKDIAFAGGIDKRELTKDRAAIERELNAKIPPLGESGGFIPHLDHTFPPDISYDNFLCYLELKEKLIG